MLKVVFVCSGNLCRSPMAAVIAERKLGQARIEAMVTSAGTLGIQGARPPQEALDAVAEVGLSLDDMPIVEACGSAEETRLYGNAASLVFDNLGDTTAVIVLGGELAIGLLAEARNRGIAVPTQLSIVGFDDPPEAALADPPLTAIAAPVAESARIATRMLFAGAPPQHIELPVELGVRRSSGACPAPPATA